jgi:hypothetical protein
MIVCLSPAHYFLFPCCLHAAICDTGAAGAWTTPHPARMAAGAQPDSRNCRRCCPVPVRWHNLTPLTSHVVCMDVQAEVLAERLQQEHFDAIYSSDLLRASQTAEAVVAAWHACGGSAPGNSSSSSSPAVHSDPQLRERHLGVLQGLTHAEAAVQQPEAFAALGADSGPAAAAVRRCLALPSAVLCHSNLGSKATDMPAGPSWPAAGVPRKLGAAGGEGRGGAAGAGGAAPGPAPAGRHTRRLPAGGLQVGRGCRLVQMPGRFVHGPVGGQRHAAA